METRIDEIASGVYGLSILAPDTAPPAGLTHNHFLISGDEPLQLSLRQAQNVPVGICGRCPDHAWWNSCAGLLSDISRRTNADQ